MVIAPGRRCIHAIWTPTIRKTGSFGKSSRRKKDEKSAPVTQRGAFPTYSFSIRGWFGRGQQAFAAVGLLLLELELLGVQAVVVTARPQQFGVRA